MKPSTAVAGFLALHLVATGAVALVAQTSKPTFDLLALLADPVPGQASRLAAVPGAARLAVLGHALVSQTPIIGVASCAFTWAWLRHFTASRCVGDFMLLAAMGTAASGLLGLCGLSAHFGLISPLFSVAVAFALFVGLDDLRPARLALAQAVVLAAMPGFHIGSAIVGVVVGAAFTGGARVFGRLAVNRYFLRMTQAHCPHLERPTKQKSNVLEALLRRKAP